MAVTGVFSLLIFSVSPTFAKAEIPQESSCITCHSDIWQETKESIHFRENISCHHCHGGDPTQSDKVLAKGPGTGYLGIPDKKQIVQTCGACHANVEVMNFYGIPTDQLAQYKTSAHGKKLLGEGDTRVAACSDCHGYHDVLPVKDAASPVYPLNLPQTCNRCHGSEKLMAHYDLPTDIFKTYLASVHGKALVEKKDLSAAHCASCHGSHGAIPPGVKAIGDTCGKCHVNEKKYFLKSVHAQLTHEGRFSECISCHGYHDIQHPQPFLYDKICLQCHVPQTTAFGRGQSIKEMLLESDKRYKETQTVVKEASVRGIFVEEENASLEEIKTNLVEMRPRQHSLKPREISKLHRNVVLMTDEIRAGIQRKWQSLKWRKIVLIPVWIFVGVMVVVLWAKYKRLKDNE